MLLCSQTLYKRWKKKVRGRCPAPSLDPPLVINTRTSLFIFCSFVFWTYFVGNLLSFLRVKSAILTCNFCFPNIKIPYSRHLAKMAAISRFCFFYKIVPKGVTKQIPNGLTKYHVCITNWKIFKIIGMLIVITLSNFHKT